MRDTGYYDKKGNIIGIINARFYPTQALSQKDVKEMTDSDIKTYGLYIISGIETALKNTETPIISSEGTKRRNINGCLALITEYRRKALNNRGNFKVRLVRILNEEKSFTITVSYLESSAKVLIPITNKIIETIKIR